jgi:predicted TIM-barrel fold metal-dependent hydrolase
LSVVDCQTHLHNRTYFEAHVGRQEYPLAERDGGGYVFRTSAGNANRIPSHYFDIEQQLEQFESQGVDVVVSSMGAFNVDHLPVPQATELAMHLNEERAELERRFPGRFYGLALVPMQDAQAAIETLDHAIRTLALRGVCIGSNVNGESIAAPERRAVYRQIDELGVPLFLHPTRTVMEDRVRRHGHEYTVAFMVDTSLAALDLIFSGALDESPTLQVVHPHLGGVLPYLAARVDIEHSKEWSRAEPLEHAPSEYLKRFHTDTVSGSTGALRLATETYGLDRMLFSSDYPYWSPADCLAHVRGAFDGDDLDAILFGNAASLLGLDPA